MLEEILGNVWYLVLAFVAIDIVSGILKAAKEGRLKSAVSYKGFIKKAGLFVALAFLFLCDGFFQTDGTLTKMGTTLIVTTEAMSIIENLHHLGIDMPFLTKYFEDYNNKEDK